ncbi:MAG: PD40 domain-containing protein [Chloroflexi bacterium]|nr:PD40 domain-containing protein [Chloroflexota bacterium]
MFRLVVLLLSVVLARSTATSEPVVLNGDIAYASDQDGDFEIYVMEADGSNIRQLTSNSEDDSEPIWSPTGEEILFTRDVGTHTEIFKMLPDGTNQTSLTPDLFSYDGQWSPDGLRIAFTVVTASGSQNVYVMDADGSNKVNLIDDDTIRVNAAPLWSNDGNHVYFITDREYPYGSALDPTTVDLYRMEASGANPTKIFTMGIYFSGMDISPVDPTLLVYGSARLGGAIFTRNLASSQESVLVNGVDDSGAYPAWAPDGSKLVFARGGTALATMDPSGANVVDLRVFDTSVRVRSPHWQPIVTEPTDAEARPCGRHSQP